MRSGLPRPHFFEIMIKLYENSFITLDEANAYFDERFASQTWLDAETSEREKALIFATKRINQLDFIGYKKDINQRLQFPRKLTVGNYISYKMPEMPQDIKDATCEEAITLLEFIKNHGEEVLNDTSFSMQSFRLGDVSFSNNANGANAETNIIRRKIMSEMANNLLSRWLKTGYDIANPVFYEEI